MQLNQIIIISNLLPSCLRKLFPKFQLIITSFVLVFEIENAYQIFHYTRCIMPKRVTSLRGPSPRNYTRATQLLLKKCCSGGEPLATLCLI